MHLRYVLTGEATIWINKLTTYISYPIQNADPEHYSKHYSAGGTELVDHNLAQNIANRIKTHNTRLGAKTVNLNPPKTHITIAHAVHTMNTTITTYNLPKLDIQTDSSSDTSIKTTTKAYNLRARKHNTKQPLHTNERWKQKKIINKPNKA